MVAVDTIKKSWKKVVLAKYATNYWPTVLVLTFINSE